MSAFKRFAGPRAPVATDEKQRAAFRLPNVLLGAAAVLLLVSMFLPYWKMTLHAPQYPSGLSVEVFVNRMTGDVAEIDGLNHYIGMRPLGEAAQLERAVSMVAVAFLVLLVLAAIYVIRRGRRCWPCRPSCGRSSSSPICTTGCATLG